MSEIHATPGHASETQRKLGISPGELRAMLAVLSHERLFGHGPTHAELHRFLGVKPKGYRLLELGWLTSKSVGPIAGLTLVRWSSTERGRAALGFDVGEEQ